MLHRTCHKAHYAVCGASFLLLALLSFALASCQGKGGNASDISVPDGVKMKSMKVEGCSFLYPDFLKEFKEPMSKEAEEAEKGRGVLLLDENDKMNALVYEVRKVDNPYSKDAAEEFLETLRHDVDSTVTSSQIMTDGFVVSSEVLDPQVAPVKLYTTIALKVKDKKSLTLTYTCTEKNKEKMLAVKDAIVKSMKVD